MEFISILEVESLRLGNGLDAEIKDMKVILG
jgi:hypothetical protein